MGGGASHLTKAQNTELNRLMKKEFHRNFDGKSEEIVRKYLMERFEECKAQVLQTHPGKAAKASRSNLYHEDSVVLPVLDAEEEWRYMLGSYNSAADFRAKAEGAFKNATSIFAGVATATSQKAGGSATWDNVVPNPYCDICCMAFRTKVALDKHNKHSPEHAKQVAKLAAEEALRQQLANLPADLRCNVCGITCKSREALQRHVQYSALHAKTMKSLKEKSTSDFEGAPLSPVIEKAEVKLLHTGSKLFYRTSTCVDFTLYHHTMAGCVEVIGCEIDSDADCEAGCGQSREIRRIYLEYSKLLSNVEPVVDAEIKRRLHEVTERHKGNINTSLLTEGPSCSNNDQELAKSTSRIALPNKHALNPREEESITQKAVVTWVFDRLQLSAVDDGTDECELFFAQNALDKVDALPQIGKPSNLGVHRAHGRRVTYDTEDIDQAITETSRAAAKANKAVTTAEMIESKVFSAEKVVFVERADSALPTRRGRRVMKISTEKSAKLRAKWRWAIRRVILRNYVAAVKERIREVELIQMLRESLRTKGKLQSRAELKNQALVYKTELPANAIASRSNSNKSQTTEVGDFDNLEHSHDSTGTVVWLNSPLSTKNQNARTDTGGMSIVV